MAPKPETKQKRLYYYFSKFPIAEEISSKISGMYVTEISGEENYSIEKFNKSNKFLSIINYIEDKNN